MCSESEKFKNAIKNSRLPMKEKKELIDYKYRIDLVNKETMHLLNKLENKINKLYN